MNTNDLLRYAGLGPWLSHPVFSAAVWAADAVGRTILCPIRRALHTAESAFFLENKSPSAINELSASFFTDIAETAENTPASHCGATELWGNCLAAIRELSSNHEDELCYRFTN